MPRRYVQRDLIKIQATLRVNTILLCLVIEH